VPALWDYLNELGYRVGVIGVPITYPVEELDGFMVSGFPTPQTDGSYTPADLAEQSPVDLNDLHADVLYTGENRDAFIEDQFRAWDATERFHEFALHDLDWDVLLTVFKQTDDIAHVCWDELPLHEAYERADRVLGSTLDYLDSLEEPTLLLVVSDHGFGPIDKTLFLNNVLIELGYTVLRDTPGTRFRAALHRRGVNLLTAYRLLSRLGLAERVLSMSYGDSRLGTILEWLRNKVFLGPKDVDPEQSACFSRGNFGQIFLNDDAVRESLVKDLLSYETDGKRVVETVYRADEEFHGSETGRAPDLMIETPDYRYVTSRGFALGTDAVLTDHVLQRQADHKSEGVLFAHGTPVDPTAAVGQPTLEDLLPTVLSALGEPRPELVDGSPLDWLATESDTTVRPFDIDEERPSDGYDDHSVEDHLESLGYTS